MATFCYRDDTGHVHELQFAVGQAPAEVRLPDGRQARRSYVAEHGRRPLTMSTGWPIECIASGVHADDRAKLSEYLRKRGVPTEISADGNPIYRNPLHRRKALAARGFHDRNSYL